MIMIGMNWMRQLKPLPKFLDTPKILGISKYEELIVCVEENRRRISGGIVVVV